MSDVPPGTPRDGPSDGLAGGLTVADWRTEYLDRSSSNTPQRRALPLSGLSPLGADRPPPPTDAATEAGLARARLASSLLLSEFDVLLESEYQKSQSRGETREKRCPVHIKSGQKRAG